LSIYFAVIFLFSRFFEKNLRISSFWLLPLVWVGVEYFRTRWPMGGFPWGQAGYPLAPRSTLIQISDLAGVYSVTALVVWVNLAIVEALGYFTDRSAVYLTTWTCQHNKTAGKALSGCLLNYGFVSKVSLTVALKKNYSQIPERAFLVGLRLPGQTRWEADDSLEELTNLTYSAGANFIGSARHETPKIAPA